MQLDAGKSWGTTNSRQGHSLAPHASMRGAATPTAGPGQCLAELEPSAPAFGGSTRTGLDTSSGTRRCPRSMSRVRLVDTMIRETARSSACSASALTALRCHERELRMGRQRASLAGLATLCVLRAPLLFRCDSKLVQDRVDQDVGLEGLREVPIHTSF